jgi:hypothetical protein
VKAEILDRYCFSFLYQEKYHGMLFFLQEALDLAKIEEFKALYRAILRLPDLLQVRGRQCPHVDTGFGQRKTRTRRVFHPLAAGPSPQPRLVSCLEVRINEREV